MSLQAQRMAILGVSGIQDLGTSSHPKPVDSFFDYSIYETSKANKVIYLYKNKYKIPQVFDEWNPRWNSFECGGLLKDNQVLEGAIDAHPEAELIVFSSDTFEFFLGTTPFRVGVRRMLGAGGRNRATKIICFYSGKGAPIRLGNDENKNGNAKLPQKIGSFNPVKEGARRVQVNFNPGDHFTNEEIRRKKTLIYAMCTDRATAMVERAYYLLSSTSSIQAISNNEIILDHPIAFDLDKPERVIFKVPLNQVNGQFRPVSVEGIAFENPVQKREQKILEIFYDADGFVKDVLTHSTNNDAQSGLDLFNCLRTQVIDYEGLGIYHEYRSSLKKGYITHCVGGTGILFKNINGSGKSLTDLAARFAQAGCPTNIKFENIKGNFMKKSVRILGEHFGANTTYGSPRKTKDTLSTLMAAEEESFDLNFASDETLLFTRSKATTWQNGKLRFDDSGQPHDKGRIALIGEDAREPFLGDYAMDGFGISGTQLIVRDMIFEVNVSKQDAIRFNDSPIDCLFQNIVIKGLKDEVAQLHNSLFMFRCAEIVNTVFENLIINVHGPRGFIFHFDIRNGRLGRGINLTVRNCTINYTGGIELSNSLRLITWENTFVNGLEFFPPRDTAFPSFDDFPLS